MSAHSSDPLPAVEAALCAHFGATPARASVSFVGVQPIEVLRFSAGSGEIVLVSLGMSRRTMTGADSATLQPGAPRAELLMTLRDPTGRFGAAWRDLAVLAAAPAVEAVVHRSGLTIDLGRPWAATSRCTGAAIGEPALPSIEWPGGTPVEVLRVLPATPTELAWARVHGAPALRALWAEVGTDLTDLGREPVALPRA